jgi:choline-sulfatase
MNRRDFIGTTGAGLAAGVLGGAPLSAQQPSASPAPSHGLARRPNIILLLPDEVRADSLACYGNPVTKTPNLDRLAAEGARFANCHVQYPVCGASRCSLLTGWPTSVRGHRSLYYFLRPYEPNLFRTLRQAGYDVFWYGKNDALAAETFADSVTEWDTPTATRGASNQGPAARSLTPGAYSFLMTAGGDRRDSADYHCIEAAIKILERKESDRPFCLFLPLGGGAHPPYTAPADFYNMYAPSRIPPLVAPGGKLKPSFHAGMRQDYNLGGLSDAVFRQIRAVYYGKVSYVDWMTGELMSALERTGHDKDTALFFLSDHGDYTGDYGLVEKWPSGLEDCLTHVPLIARVPGGTPGAVDNNMVELYDVMATALELAGTEAHHTHFARSLAPQLSGGAGDPDRAAFAEGGYNVYEPQCIEPLGAGGGIYAAKIRLQNERPVTVSRSAMVRTRTHKLIVRPQDQSELYAYASDPREEQNLFGDRAAAAVQAELQTKLLDHFVNTTGIAPWDKDSRACPPFYPTRTDIPPAGWQRSVLGAG